MFEFNKKKSDVVINRTSNLNKSSNSKYNYPFSYILRKDEGTNAVGKHFGKKYEVFEKSSPFE